MTPNTRVHWFVSGLGVCAFFAGPAWAADVYQGTVKRDTQLFVDEGRKPFKVGHLFKLRGKEHA